MSKIKFPIKTVYYEDELNDEFSKAVIEAKQIDESYKYISKNPFWKLIRFFFYRVIATPFAFIYTKLTLRLKIKNKNALKQCKKTGYFLYLNHTQETADAFIPSVAAFPKGVYTVVHPANVSIKVLGRINPYLGALPTPTALRATRNFKNAIERRLLEKNVIAIYPEAHIWPFYTGIRNFPDTSFNFPVMYNEASFSLTTTYKSRGDSKKPKAVSYIDGPFYPNMELHPRERAKDLRDRIYNAMLERSKESDCEYIKYIKKGTII